MEFIMNKKPKVNIITVTLNRPSLVQACKSVDEQTYKNWHHFVLGDGVLPDELRHPNRSVFGFSHAYGKEEPGLNMPDGTPNPLQRWALNNLKLDEYFCFLDDDNIYDKNFLKKMVATIESNPDIGCVLCGVKDQRHFQNITGEPILGRCDNSGVIFRTKLATKIEFPHASLDKNVVQDVEFIQKVSKKFGWRQLSETLVTFGSAPNVPTVRGGIKLLSSWELPLFAFKKLKEGKISDAIQDLLTSLQIDPLDGYALWRLAEAYAVSGNIKKSKECLRKWIHLAEESHCFSHHFITFCCGLSYKALNLPTKNLFKKAIETIDTSTISEQLSCEWYRIVSNEKREIKFYSQILQQIESDSTKVQNALWKARVAAKLFPRQQNIQAAYELLHNYYYNKEITVLTITRGRPKLLARAIDSVKAQENARNVNHLIIIDDCKETLNFLETNYHTDDSIQWEFVKRTSKEVNGPARIARLRNKGINTVHTKYLAMLDDDNEYTPDHLKTLLNLAKTENLLAVHSWRRLFTFDGKPFTDNFWPWETDKPSQKAKYKDYVKRGIVDQDSNILRDGFDNNTVDTSAWLLETKTMQSLLFPEKYSTDDIAKNIVEDKKFYQIISSRPNIKIGTTKKCTLKYYLGGYSTDFNKSLKRTK